MSRKKILSFISIIAIISAVIFIFYLLKRGGEIDFEGDHIFEAMDEDIIESVRSFNRQSEPLVLGPLEIGGEMPGGPGDTTFAPYMEIPISKFYVSIAEPDTWCINEDCDIEGAFIQTMGGWLEVKHAGVTIDELFGLDMPENKNVKSIVLIGDHNGKIAGIYPNRGLKDVIPILKLHPDLADFSLLEGVESFRSLKVGEPAPLRPGDSISRFSDKLADFAERVPENKKFYLYAIEKKKYDIVGMYEPIANEYVCFISGCRYPNPDPPHDFLYAQIDELGGWFLANDQNNSEMVKLFGLNQEEVIAGKSSLVILTDSDGIIRAIHPNKTSSDAFTILSQHPELADIRGLYR